MKDTLVKSLVGLGLGIAKEVVEKLIEGEDIRDMRVRDTKAWREWERREVKGDFTKFLRELRKRFKK